MAAGFSSLAMINAREPIKARASVMSPTTASSS